MPSQIYGSTRAVTGTAVSLPLGTAPADTGIAPGIFQLWIDLSPMTAGDEYEIMIYDEVANAISVMRACLFWTVAGVQSKPIWVAPSLILVNGCDFVMRKAAGTDRTFTFSVRKA